MNMKKLSIILPAMLLLVACARQPNVQQPYETQAEKQKKDIQSKVANSNSSYKNCFDAANAESSIFKRSSEFLLLSDTQPNKLDLLSSRARLNEKQKTTLREFGAAASKCRQVFISNLNGVPTQPIFIKNYRLYE
jgi:hypothetical protein